jgi:hypothetical protein
VKALPFTAVTNTPKRSKSQLFNFSFLFCFFVVAVKAQVVSNADLLTDHANYSEVLLHACVERTLQILYPPTPSRNPFFFLFPFLWCLKHSPIDTFSFGEKENGDNWWEEWQMFAEQFYCFTEYGLLDYKKYVQMMSEYRTSQGKPVKDNALIWLLVQSLRTRCLLFILQFS